jgi:hypothetical protein
MLVVVAAVDCILDLPVGQATIWGGMTKEVAMVATTLRVRLVVLRTQILVVVAVVDARPIREMYTELVATVVQAS